MTVLHVTLGTTVQVILTLNQLDHAHQAITAQGGHLYQPKMSHPKVTSQRRLLFFHVSVQLELTRRQIEQRNVLIAQRRTFVMKWG